MGCVRDSLIKVACGLFPKFQTSLAGEFQGGTLGVQARVRVWGPPAKHSSCGTPGRFGGGGKSQAGFLSGPHCQGALQELPHAALLQLQGGRASALLILKEAVFTLKKGCFYLP